jgi:hypothetical protein
MAVKKRLVDTSLKIAVSYLWNNKNITIVKIVNSVKVVKM